MRFSLTIIILIGFLGMALFGAVLMEYSMMHHGNCLASAMMGDACPPDQAGTFWHHLAASQLFFDFFPPTSVGWLLSFFLGLLGFLIVLGSPPALPEARQLIRRSGERLHYFLQPYLSWLSLFEHSPTGN